MMLDPPRVRVPRPRDQPPPDWADVVVESLPTEPVGVSDPAQWAQEVFSARSPRSSWA